MALGAFSGSALYGNDGRAPGAIIQVYLPGGPSHLDTLDPKPEAPAHVRGEFRTIATSVPGLRFCEHLPGLASLARHLTVARGLTGLRDEHAAVAFDSGGTAPGRAGLGAALVHRWGSTVRTPSGEMPAAIDLSVWTSAGPLGESFAPDRLGRGVARVGHFNEVCAAAVDEPLVGTEAPGRALDIRREPPRAWERYGADGHAQNGLFLKDRRLVQAGARCVAVAWGYWDTHGDNFGQLRRQLPLFDRGLSALVEDLRNDGRLSDVVIVAGGEFGRSPKVNDGGRPRPLAAGRGPPRRRRSVARACARSDRPGGGRAGRPRPAQRRFQPGPNLLRPRAAPPTHLPSKCPLPSCEAAGAALRRCAVRPH
ncbi:DUF1501 domain-containing protein [Gemmata sp. JC673]|uniref:DUF1501 domain-containing protein n=1 Tax=Gemmata algarum TaxID=2975278 RepID=A0ABU5EZ25_9BACT|nr:DUF1501 domain-containing protein [Gemmata algarum]MDY3560557.1 DUF1501 domain-containing protein [Gemmata algarum]